MQPAVSYKALIEYICDPDGDGFCSDLYDRPDEVDDEDVQKYWGYLALFNLFVSSAIVSG